MRLSVPAIPHAVLNAKPAPAITSIQHASEYLSNFLSKGNVALLTGAGVSVDSGIRAYRGEDGRYLNPNYKPIFYHELMDSTPKGHTFRQRYWLRSYLGYPLVRDTLPNTTHFALAALQHTLCISKIVTQNVDGLHNRALQIASPRDASRLKGSILELHGTLHRVHCDKGHVVDRQSFQGWLSSANPQWHQYAQEVERTGNQPRTNPDGDVAIEHLGGVYENFVIPECPDCLSSGNHNSVFKPEVIFFGESIPDTVRHQSYKDIEACDRLLIIGSTLATYSAFRLLKHAVELGKPVLLVNVGPTRADGYPNVEKIDLPIGTIVRDVARNVIGTRALEDPVVVDMLRSGIVKPPEPHDDERRPRAVRRLADPLQPN